MGQKAQQVNERGLDFHPLSNVFNEGPLQLDPGLQGDQYEGGMHGGDVVPGSNSYKGLDKAGLAADALPVAEFFGKAIAGGALGGAAGGGEAAAGTDLEAVGTSAPGASAPVAQAQAASLTGNAGTDTLGASGSQMPPATPEPAGGPTAPGGSAAPNATMPAAVPEPAGGPTAPGGSAAQPTDSGTPDQKTDQTNKPKSSLFDTVKTAASVLTPISTLLAAASARKSSKAQLASSNNQPPPAPAPAELPSATKMAPIVERSVIADQVARRGRASTILTSDANDRLGG